MSKKLIIILVNFVVILMITVVLANQIKTFKKVEDVYVAKVLIKKGVKITPDMIGIESVTLNHEKKIEPKGTQLVTYYNDVIKDPSQVVGRYAAYDFVPGEILVDDKLADAIDLNYDYLYSLPAGYYAYVVPNTIPGGILKVNDYIDLYIYDKDQGMVEEPSLRHLRVYDLRTKDGASATQITDEETDEAVKLSADYIVVALNDYQLKKLIDFEQKDAVVKAALRRRPNSEFEVYNYEGLLYDEFKATYPDFAINDSLIIDSIKEQEIIEANKIRMEEEAKAKQQQTKDSNDKQ